MPRSDWSPLLSGETYTTCRFLQGPRLPDNGGQFQTETLATAASFLVQQGRGNEARTMLAEICSWFFDGFDTEDLS